MAAALRLSIKEAFDRQASAVERTGLVPAELFARRARRSNRQRRSARRRDLQCHRTDRVIVDDGQARASFEPEDVAGLHTHPAA